MIRYLPAESVTVLALPRIRAGLSAETGALPTTAPVPSVTTPEMLDVTCAHELEAIRKVNKRPTTHLLFVFI
jgi:hypothetical protein